MKFALDKHSFDLGVEAGAVLVPVLAVALRRLLVRLVYAAALSLGEDAVKDYVREHFMKKPHVDPPKV